MMTKLGRPFGTACAAACFFASAQSQGGAPSTFESDIRWTVQFHYGQDYEDLDNKVPVLIMESTYMNLSKERSYHLSFWGLDNKVMSLLPKTAYKNFPTQPGLGMPSPPKRDQLVELKPGGSHTIRQWFWAHETLPWQNSDRTKGFRVSKAQNLEITFVADFKDDAMVFQNTFHLKGLHCDSGRLKSQPLTFPFKIHSPEGSTKEIPAETAPKLLTNLEAFATFHSQLEKSTHISGGRKANLKSRADEIATWLAGRKIVGSLSPLEPTDPSASVRIRLLSGDAKEIQNAPELRNKKIRYYWNIEFVNRLTGGFVVYLNAESGEIAWIRTIVEG